MIQNFVVVFLVFFLTLNAFAGPCTCELEGTECVVRYEGKFQASTPSENRSCARVCGSEGVLARYCSPFQAPASTSPVTIPNLPEGYESASATRTLFDLPEDTYLVLNRDVSFNAKAYKKCLMGECLTDFQGPRTYNSFVEMSFNKTPVSSNNVRILSKNKIFVLSKITYSNSYQLLSDEFLLTLTSTDKKTEIGLLVKIGGQVKDGGSRQSHTLSNITSWFDVYTPPASVIK